MFAVYDTTTGALISVGTIVANPLPAGLTSIALSAPDVAGLRNGSRRWNPTSRVVELTPGWVDPAIADGNRATILAQADTARAANTTFLGIGSPSNAQNAAQVRALTVQMNKMIRLAVNALDGTD